MTEVSRRAVYAARFLKPPGFFKRAIMRDKPRVMTGPYENPVRKLVRLREKAREFSEIPPPRKIPVAKPPPLSRQFLKPVEGVPKVAPECLQARLDFLLSENAVEQQRLAPMLPGQTPYTAELAVWERQMREVRKIYRAQYLQKLEQVTREEASRELELYKQETAEKNQRRLDKLQAKSIEMKRAALLLDRKRIESKVNETIEMTRRSKLKMRKLAFIKRIEDNMEPLSTDFADSGNVHEDNGKGGPTGSGGVLDRNVSVPFLLRQLGGAMDLPKQKNRRIHKVENVHRELLESSYELHGEHEDDFIESVKVDQKLIPVDEVGLSAQERAELYYTNFSPDEKLELIEQKIHMLQERLIAEETKGSIDPLTAQLMDILAAAKAAHLEEEQEDRMNQVAEKDDNI
jgi:hypothetical protein